MKKNTNTNVDTTLPAAVNTPTELMLPHEQDESVGSTGGVQSVTVQQAYKDVKRGLKDTSRGAAANEAYEKLKRNTK